LTVKPVVGFTKPYDPSWLSSRGKAHCKFQRNTMIFSSMRMLFNFGFPLSECSVLCPITCVKLHAAQAGFEPATPAFWCRRLNHLTTELVEVKRWIRMGIVMGTAMDRVPPEWPVIHFTGDQAKHWALSAYYVKKG
jgi:hypothetical protein